MNQHTKLKSIQDQRADEVYKILGAVGFLLNAFDELDRLSGFSGGIFSMGLKNAAKKFKVHLEASERIFTHGEVQTNEVMMQQMADSYEVVDNLMTLMLQAGRILTPQAMELMNNDMLETARRWGIVLEAKDVYTPSNESL